MTHEFSDKLQKKKMSFEFTFLIFFIEVYRMLSSFKSLVAEDFQANSVF